MVSGRFLNALTSMPELELLREAAQVTLTGRDKLVALLSCLNKVSEVSPMLGGFVESGEMFHALRLTAEEAYDFLKSIPVIEGCGVMCLVLVFTQYREITDHDSKHRLPVKTKTPGLYQDRGKPLLTFYVV